MPPVLHRFVKIFTFSNVDPEIPSQLLGVSNAVFCYERNLLYVADDKGYIRCFNVDWIVNLLNEVVAEKDKEEAATKKMKGSNLLILIGQSKDWAAARRSLDA